MTPFARCKTYVYGLSPTSLSPRLVPQVAPELYDVILGLPEAMQALQYKCVVQKTAFPVGPRVCPGVLCTQPRLPRNGTFLTAAPPEPDLSKQKGNFISTNRQIDLY
jgi:hypothetical protein